VPREDLLYAADAASRTALVVDRDGQFALHGVADPDSDRPTRNLHCKITRQGVATGGAGVSGRDLVGTTRRLAGLSALLATVSAGYHMLSGFSNGSGKKRAVFDEYIHYGDCRIATN
jgi:hypothetical protein